MPAAMRAQAIATRVAKKISMFVSPSASTRARITLTETASHVHERPRVIHMAALYQALIALVFSVCATAAPLSKSAIPFVMMPSGSVSASGAVTGITALPTAYAAAYCYLPANVVAPASAAAWQFCSCSSTTVCQAYLNSYTAGTPTIPQRLTPVTAGQGAYTGVTTETFGPTVYVPANALGTNGQLAIAVNWSSNTAGTKYTRVRFGGTVGPAFMAGTLASQIGRQDGVLIANRGASSQVGTSIGNVGGYGANGGNTSTYAAVDTTVPVPVTFSIENLTATNYAVIERYSIDLAAPDVLADTSRILVAEGDSITWGDASYIRYYMATAPPGTQLFNFAIPGATLADAIARQAQALQVKASNPNASTYVFSAMIGGNGFAAAGTQALLDQIATLAGYYDTFRAAGFKTICITWPPRTTPTFNPARNQVNVAMRGWLGTHCDAIADFAADPIMGPDSAASHLTLYFDGIHPSAYGHAIFEAIIRTLINGF